MTTASRGRFRSRWPGLALVVAIGAAGAGSGSGCASTQAPGGLLTGGDQDGSVASSDGGVVVGSEAGTPTPAPPAIGVSIFSDQCTAGTTTVDWSPLRRVSRDEYDNMVRDLLGDTSHPSATFQFPPEASPGVGMNLPLVNTYLPADTTAVTQYLEAAEALAESAVADTNRVTNVILSGIASCSKAHDDTCATDFIATWVNRAYRGQLDATESANLLTMFQSVEGQVDWTTGLQAVITAVLESPRFLYVFEFGNGSPSGSVVPLSSGEVAARLAFFLWRSVPDNKVMADAAAGALGTTAGIATEAQYMLTAKNPNTNLFSAPDPIDDFTNQWLQLTGVQAKDVQFATFNMNANLAAEMYDEARLDFSQLVLVANGKFQDLMTSTSSYVTSDLATFYGYGPSAGTGPTASGPSTNATFTQTTLANRPGILTNGGVMATQAHSTLPSLVYRGKLVRENLLCDPIGNPPPGIPGPATEPPDAGTTRTLLLAHMQKGTICPVCHTLMDPMGVAFGNFDAAGAFQSTDANGFTPATNFPAVDSSGTISPTTAPTFTPDPMGLSSTFTNVTDFTTQLGSSTQGEECFALQQFRFAVGRIENVDDACSAQQAYSAFSTNGFNIQQLLLAIVQSDAMRYRSAATAGSACK